MFVADVQDDEIPAGVDADLLEHAAVHDRHGAAAAILSGGVGLAFPVLADEPAGRQPGMGAGEFVLDLLELGAYPVAQAGEPGPCFFLPAKDGRLVGQW